MKNFALFAATILLVAAIFTGDAEAGWRYRRSPASRPAASACTQAPSASRLQAPSAAATYYQVCFYDRYRQYAGSAVSTDTGALQRQCENWAQLHGGFCTGFHIYPYDCPNNVYTTAEAGCVVCGSQSALKAPASRDSGYILAHKTLTVAPEFAGAHRFELKGSINGSVGKGVLTIDPNTFELNGFGDRTVGTVKQPITIDVEFLRLRVSDPAVQGREVYSIHGKDMPADQSYSLVIGRHTLPQVLRLIVSEKGNSTAFPLVPATEFDFDPK